tara:strand:+ start:112 stop:879 length:768 start_codon:yes stop_codon:yes gene_type:complete
MIKLDNPYSMFSLEDKVAIVTGGNGMLGKEFVKTLSDAGATVFIFDIINGIDITDKKQVSERIKKIVNEHGNVDILINNAALNPRVGSEAEEIDKFQFGPYEDYPEELWNKEIAVGLTGAQICIQETAKTMMKKKNGVVVNISSEYGVVAPNNDVYEEGCFKSIAYPTVKSAILGLTRGWAGYLAPYGIRVNTLVPGGVFAGQDESFVEKNRKLNMLGRMASKDEYNGAILFLCSEASSFMTGSMLVVDGGRTAW